jgi:hypothetical protein
MMRTTPPDLYGPRVQFRGRAAHAGDGSHGVLTGGETDARINRQALDPARLGVVGKQQAQARTEGNDLDIDLFRAVVPDGVVGDIQDQVLPGRVSVADLEHEFVFREGLVIGCLGLGAHGQQEQGNGNQGRAQGLQKWVHVVDLLWPSVTGPVGDESGDVSGGMGVVLNGALFPAAS